MSGASEINDRNKAILTKRGWRIGSSLENSAARFLSGAGPVLTGNIEQQYRVGSYRIDFAWPDVRVALEVDGWHHRSPEGAAKDALKDSFLRSRGWLVLRVDDRNGRDAMTVQLAQVCRLVIMLKQSDWSEVWKDHWKATETAP